MSGLADECCRLAKAATTIRTSRRRVADSIANIPHPISTWENQVGILDWLNEKGARNTVKAILPMYRRLKALGPTKDYPILYGEFLAAYCVAQPRIRKHANFVLEHFHECAASATPYGLSHLLSDSIHGHPATAAVDYGNIARILQELGFGNEESIGDTYTEQDAATMRVAFQQFGSRS